jgi:hypothetical protein
MEDVNFGNCARAAADHHFAKLPAGHVLHHDVQVQFGAVVSAFLPGPG